MSNLVLYRKYRPQTFAEVIGQPHIVQTLTNAIASASLSHAYLFSGPRGSGKTTIARILAKAVNCQNLIPMVTPSRISRFHRGSSTKSGLDKVGTPNTFTPHQNLVGGKHPTSNYEPCNKCSSCLEITAGNAIDLIEIDAASHRGIDDIRELRDGIRFSPVKSKYKVFIIDECHQLSKDAANALLKTLEEPPAHAIFVLATTEIHKMIPTIISRCQRFDFKKIQVSDIVKKLEYIVNKENVKFDKSALSLIALNSRGSFRDAESLLDECLSFAGKKSLISVEDIEELLGIVDIGQISQLIDLLIQKDAKAAITHINKLFDVGIDLQEFAKTLIYYLRQILLLKITPDFLSPEDSGLSIEEIEKIKNQASKLQEKEIQNILEIFIDAENKMKYASILQLPLELAIVDIIIK